MLQFLYFDLLSFLGCVILYRIQPGEEQRGGGGGNGILCSRCLPFLRYVLHVDRVFSAPPAKYCIAFLLLEV